MISVLKNFFFSEPEPLEPFACGSPHAFRIGTSQVMHDAWLCKDPDLCFGNKKKDPGTPYERDENMCTRRHIGGCYPDENTCKM